MDRAAAVAHDDHVADLLARIGAADSESIPIYQTGDAAHHRNNQAHVQAIAAHRSSLQRQGGYQPEYDAVDESTHPIPLPDLVATDKQSGRKLKWGEIVQKASALPNGLPVKHQSTIAPPKEVYAEARANPDLNYARAFNMAYDGPTGAIAKVYRMVDGSHRVGGGNELEWYHENGMVARSENNGDHVFGWGIYTTVNGLSKTASGYGPYCVIGEYHTGRTITKSDLVNKVVPRYRASPEHQADKQKWSQAGAHQSSEALWSAAAAWAGYSTISDDYGGSPMLVAVDPARFKTQTIVDTRNGNRGVTVKGYQYRDATSDEQSTSRSSEWYAPDNASDNRPEGWRGQARTQ